MAENSVATAPSSLLDAFLSNRPLFIKIAANITGCRSQAEDVLQDAYFRVRSAPTITTSLKAQFSYLMQIVRNLAIDHYRKQSLDRRYTTAEDEGLNVEIPNSSPEVTHTNQIILEAVSDALAQLPPRTRYAFEMYRIHGVQQKEIAKELGVSPTLVNFMIRDALLHCRKYTEARQLDAA